MHAYFSFTGLIGWHTTSWFRSWFQDGGKISPCVDLRNKRKNYSVQVFKTMQCVHWWIGPFDIVFAAYCCGIFVPASVVSYITFFLLSDRSFKVFQVSLLFRHNSCLFLRKSTQTLGNQCCNGLMKDATSSSCVGPLVSFKRYVFYLMYKYRDNLLCSKF